MEEKKRELCDQYWQYLTGIIIAELSEEDFSVVEMDEIYIMVESLLVAGEFTDREKEFFQVAYQGVQAFKENGRFEKLAQFYTYNNGKRDWIDEVLAWLCNPDPLVQMQNEFIIRILESGKDEAVRKFMRKNELSFEDFMDKRNRD